MSLDATITADPVMELQNLARASLAKNRVELPDGTELLEGFVEYLGFTTREGQFTVVDEALEQFFLAKDADDEGIPEEGMDRGVNLAVNAPVATGKSAAAVFIGLGSGQRTVLGSSNKGLQAQYMEKDLPEIARYMLEAHNYVMTFAILKGQRHYANLVAIRDHLAGQSPDTSVLHDVTDADLEILQLILDQTEQGMEDIRNGGDGAALDVGHLVDQLSEPKFRRAACAESNGSKGERGWWSWAPPRGEEESSEPGEGVITSMFSTALSSLQPDMDGVVEDSPYLTAYWRAMTADVCVVNHHLLIADLLRYEAMGNFIAEERRAVWYPSIVKGSGMVVVDEGQHYPATLTAAMSKEFKLWSYIFTLSSCAKRLASDRVKMGKSNAYKVIKAMEKAVRDVQEALDKLLEGEEYSPEDVTTRFDALRKRLYALYEQARRPSGEDTLLRLALEDQSTTQAKSFGNVMSEIGDAIIRPLYEFEPTEDWNVSMQSDSNGVTVNMVPLNIRPHRKRLLRAQRVPNLYSLIAGQRSWNGVFGTAMMLMSGTLSDKVGTKIGMVRDHTAYVSVDSPMNPERARICVPGNLPSLKQGYQKWMDASVETLVDAVSRVRGRTLVLCTSRKAMETYADALRRKTDSRVICQGDAADKRATIDLFKLEPNAVLIGLKSYWEGVDLPGDDLLLVVMDKMHFPIQDDPIYSALADAEEMNGGNPFYDVTLDHANFMFAQGAGRLMRRESDMGGILVLDPRFIQERYGASALKLAPKKSPFTADYELFMEFMEEVVELVDGDGEEPEAPEYGKDQYEGWVHLSEAGVRGAARKSRGGHLSKTPAVKSKGAKNAKGVNFR